MAYVTTHNDQVLIQAVLTKKGRLLLSDSEGYFNVAKFALSDDLIDYLLDKTQMQSTPILQPSTDGSNLQKYKLMTLTQGSSKVSVLSVSTLSMTFSALGSKQKLSPTTVPTPLPNDYSFAIPYASYFDIKRYDRSGNLITSPSIKNVYGDGVVNVTAHSILLLLSKRNTTGQKLLFTVRVSGTNAANTLLIATVILVSHSMGDTGRLPSDTDDPQDNI